MIHVSRAYSWLSTVQTLFCIGKINSKQISYDVLNYYVNVHTQFTTNTNSFKR